MQSEANQLMALASYRKGENRCGEKKEFDILGNTLFSFLVKECDDNIISMFLCLNNATASNLLATFSIKLAWRCSMIPKSASYQLL